MIRHARFQDIPEIVAMLHEMQRASKYAGRVSIVDKVAETMLLGLIAGQNQTGPQAGFCSVAETGGGLVGFMAGVLDRVYHIGDRLVANDVYLFARPGSGKAALALIDAYIAWGRANSRVIEIKLSWTDALPAAGRIAAAYGRKGAAKVGEIYELRLDADALQEAA